MLTVHLDTRTIDVALPNGPATMRAPSVAEWREIRRRYIEASEKIAADPEQSADVRYGDDAPYAAAFAHAVSVLAGVTEPDPDQLPLGATTITPFEEMAKLWQPAPVTYQGAPEPPAGDAFTPIPGA